MPSAFDLLVEIIHSATLDLWKERNEKALADLVNIRYGKRAEKSVSLRAPDMKGNPAGVSYAAYIHPQSAESGGYGGTSFAIFPVEGQPSLVTMCIGTGGLAPDEMILGRPGHARKIQAVCAWLNHSAGHGSQVAWAKQDPTRIDIETPVALQNAWPEYGAAFKKYGKYLYAIYRPTKDRTATTDTLTGMLDILFQERGQLPLKEYQENASEVKSKWFRYLMPTTTSEDVADQLKNRRYVIIQGPPGTGKTRMARQMLTHNYASNGQTIQFHPNTTYENFIGGLAPVQERTEDQSTLGFRFAPRQGFLMESAARAAENPTKNYLLHIDEINRADLGKILGEAIYLLEPTPEAPRKIELAYDFGTPFFRTLILPDNLHILGTMNSADRSIAILDVAVRRRFAFMSLWPNLKVVEDNGCDLSIKAFNELVSTFIEHANEDALALVPGHSYFLGKDEASVRANLRTSLSPLLTEYLAQGYVSGFAEAIRAYLQWLESL